jgi:hypothetical protein
LMWHSCKAAVERHAALHPPSANTVEIGASHSLLLL